MRHHKILLIQMSYHVKQWERIQWHGNAKDGKVLLTATSDTVLNLCGYVGRQESLLPLEGVWNMQEDEIDHLHQSTVQALPSASSAPPDTHCWQRMCVNIHYMIRTKIRQTITVHSANGLSFNHYAELNPDISMSVYHTRQSNLISAGKRNNVGSFLLIMVSFTQKELWYYTAWQLELWNLKSVHLYFCMFTTNHIYCHFLKHDR